ncbi:P-loop containing nucleoside triphosphate hydrolase protein [Halenospora varia]|nr:P-loop containing nucleoside triphosphate hydrolase protein [Halenospora varia]
MSVLNGTKLRTREIPMRILNLGLSRTGTTSMKTALEELGLQNVYHLGYEDEDFAFWLAAIEAKYEGKGQPFGRKEWDHIFYNCDAVSDLPVVMFAEELIAAYPEAKVILTIRSVDSWYYSMIATVCNPIYKTLYHRLPAWLDSQEQALCDMSDKCEKYTWQNDFPKHGKVYFHEHNSLVRKLVPKENLLEMEMKGGWKPLCAFLDKEVPETEFPRGNGVQAFLDEANEHTKAKYLDLFKQYSIVAAPFLFPMVGITIYHIGWNK